jgi:hypothetical protein
MATTAAQLTAANLTDDDFAAALVDALMPQPEITDSQAAGYAAIAAFTTTYAISSDERFTDFLAFLRETGAGKIAEDESATRADLLKAALLFTTV